MRTLGVYQTSVVTNHCWQKLVNIFQLAKTENKFDIFISTTGTKKCYFIFGIYQQLNRYCISEKLSNTCCWYIKYKSLIENIQEHHHQHENEKDQIRMLIHQNVAISPCVQEKTGQLTARKMELLTPFFP